MAEQVSCGYAVCWQWWSVGENIDSKNRRPQDELANMYVQSFPALFVKQWLLLNYDWITEIM